MHTETTHTDTPTSIESTDHVEPVQPAIPPTEGPAETGTVRVGPASAVEPKIFEELAAVARDVGCELLHVGRHGNALQLVVDHADGVTIDHCSAVSRQAGALLDGLDYGRGRYVLEVSSPGLDREFYQLSDYQTFIGSSVKVVHRENGQKATVRGKLTGFDPENASIELLEVGSDTVVQLNVRDIQTTRLEIDI